MALLVPNEGELQMMKIVLNNETQEDLKLDLFTNDYTPVEGSVLTDFTLAAGGGYGAKTLSKGSWSCATLVGVTSAQYSQQTWLFTADVGDCYGYVIHGATSGKVFWAQKWTSAESTYNGKEIKMTPYIEFE